jgi:hypothetical protein
LGLSARFALLSGLLAAGVDGTGAGAAGAEGADPEAGGGTEMVRACMRANEPKTTSVQSIRLEAHDRSGGVTYSKATVYWSREETGLSKVMARIFEPPDMRGAGLLLIEEDDHAPMYMYLPETGRVRRVNKHMAQGSLFGTDFTYEEFQHIYGLVKDQKSVRLPDEELDGRPVYVLSGTPGAGSSYERTRFIVDKASCVPLRMEFYERGDRLRKLIVADVDSIIEVDGRHLAEKLEARDQRDGTKSLLLVEKIEFGVRIPRRTFSTNWLETGRR